MHWFLRTKFEGKKRNAEGLNFSFELESLRTNKGKGYSYIYICLAHMRADTMAQRREADGIVDTTF